MKRTQTPASKTDVRADKRREAPRSRRIEELSDQELAMISEARVPAEHDHLDALLDD